MSETLCSKAKNTAKINRISSVTSVLLTYKKISRMLCSNSQDKKQAINRFHELVAMIYVVHAREKNLKKLVEPISSTKRTDRKRKYEGNIEGRVWRDGSASRLLGEIPSLSSKTLRQKLHKDKS